MVPRLLCIAHADLKLHIFCLNGVFFLQSSATALLPGRSSAMVRLIRTGKYMHWNFILLHVYDISVISLVFSWSENYVITMYLKHIHFYLNLTIN